ncbi:MAG TPA: glycosyltransferase [Candidatus Saccharimonadia bacterium]|nr:glycosyltransferase [Candidatus Saccharimonadia bacterium]
MYWFIGLLATETVLEGLLCAGVFSARAQLRRIATLLTLVMLLMATGGLSVLAWSIWIWTLPLTIYRCINLLRIFYKRLPTLQLRAVGLRAFIWLAMSEILLVLFAWFVDRYQLANLLFTSLVAVQLLSALMLVRVSLHTWRHAAVSSVTAAMSDKELPSVSVLVPARNETDDLEQYLETLVQSDYPKLEILVLDDCSVTRRTPEIVRSFAHAGVRFLQGAAPDETRWLAKNYAYEQLAHEASGDVLLFSGVDVVFAPHTIRQLVALLETRKKDMLSVMPLRATTSGRGSSLLQAMRYYWEMCLPRRLFKRPPVLSTCWLIRSRALKRMGGFAAISRSVNPEAPLARQAVVTDAYSFVRSDEMLGLYSNKPASEQYDTSVRMRYPQLHRRLELVGLAALFEILLLLGPFIGLVFSVYMPHRLLYISVWLLCIVCLSVTYCLVAVGARLTQAWYGWLLVPVAFIVDLIILHVSLWKYEFSTVYWKGRNVCIPVMGVGSVADYDLPATSTWRSE